MDGCIFCEIRYRRSTLEHLKHQNNNKQFDWYSNKNNNNLWSLNNWSIFIYSYHNTSFGTSPHKKIMWDNLFIQMWWSVLVNMITIHNIVLSKFNDLCVHLFNMYLLLRHWINWWLVWHITLKNSIGVELIELDCTHFIISKLWIIWDNK